MEIKYVMYVTTVTLCYLMDNEKTVTTAAIIHFWKSVNELALQQLLWVFPVVSKSKVTKENHPDGTEIYDQDSGQRFTMVFDNLFGNNKE